MLLSFREKKLIRRIKKFHCYWGNTLVKCELCTYLIPSTNLIIKDATNRTHYFQTQLLLIIILVRNNIQFYKM